MTERTKRVLLPVLFAAAGILLMLSSNALAQGSGKGHKGKINKGNIEKKLKEKGVKQEDIDKVKVGLKKGAKAVQKQKERLEKKAEEKRAEGIKEGKPENPPGMKNAPAEGEKPGMRYGKDHEGDPDRHDKGLHRGHDGETAAADMRDIVKKKMSRIREKYRKMGRIALEQTKHIRRLARLKRIEKVATEAGNEQLLEKVKKIRSREKARHEKALTKIRQSAPIIRKGKSSMEGPK